MNQVIPVFKREFAGYFRSPVGYVLLAGFSVLIVGVSFFWVPKILEANAPASLEGLFFWFPWLFVILVPATGMRLWAEERRSGTVELLFTLPITTTAAVIGKFLAAWAFLSVAVLLTFPVAMTIGYLGNPDWYVIIAGYIGGILMAGSYLGICSLTSAFTRNQVISFILGFMICLLIALLGFGPVSDVLKLVFPTAVVDAVSNFSFYPHFDTMTRGLIDLPSVVFFLSVAVFSLLANIVVLER